MKEDLEIRLIELKIEELFLRLDPTKGEELKIIESLVNETKEALSQNSIEKKGNDLNDRYKFNKRK